MKTQMWTQTWKYKDENREYWKIVAKPEPPSSAYCQWAVAVKRQDLTGKWTDIFNGYVVGQYHEPLSLHKCLLAWSHHQAALVIGMAHHAK